MGQFFVMNTSGHCFLCLSRVARPSKAWKSEDGYPLPNSDSNGEYVGNTFSFHKICQYLELSLVGVVAATSTSVPSTSASVFEESSLELQAVLCDKCAQLNVRFSKQILELEEIQTKLQSSLRSFCDTILEVDENHEGRLEGFREEMIRGSESLAQVEAVEQLRKATLERCSQKLQTSSVQKAIESIMDVKVEPHPDDENVVSDPEEADYLNDNGSESNSSLVECDICHLNVKDLRAHLSSHHQKLDGNRKTKHRIRQYRTILPRTRKVEESDETPPLEIPLVSKCPKKAKVLPTSRDHHSCSLCGKKFARIAYLTIHKKTIHLQLRDFRCNVCGRAFSQKGSLNRHRRAVHFSKALKTMKASDVIHLDPLSDPTFNSTVPEVVATKPTASEFHSELDDKPVSSINPETGKHKCSLCSREFSKYSLFNYHYQTAHLNLRFECTICGLEFRQRCSYNRHHKKAHMGI